jgi:single-strand DNA-binding protein
MLNAVQIQGNLTRDPEVRTSEGGVTYARFAVAFNAPPRKGEDKGAVSYFECVAFGKTAEIIGEYCGKGKQVIVQGRLEQQRWTDEETGQKRSNVQIVVEPMGLNFVSDSSGKAAAESEGNSGGGGQPDASGAQDGDDVPF